MPTIFTQIIEGEIPGAFVWRDEVCVAFMTIAPLRPGHTLVVPIEETDHWLDLEDSHRNHLMNVAAQVGRAIDHAFQPEKVGLMIAGLEVPHTHIHLVPIDGVADLDFANADSSAKQEDIETAAEKIRTALEETGARGVTR